MATDTAVYAAALDSLFAPHDSSRLRAIVLLDSTAGFPQKLSDTSLASGYTERLPISLRSIESALAASVARPFTIADDSVLLHTRQSLDSTLAQLPPEEGFRRVEIFWQLFYQKFPNTLGYASLSAIAYDSGSSTAIVYVQHSCGGLCGSGEVVRLKREDDRWRVVSIKQTWVS